MSEKLDGFVIQGPGHPLHMCFSTFAPTMAEAWMRFIGFRERPPGKLATVKGRWRAMGWRPVAASLSLSPEAPASSKEEGE